MATRIRVLYGLTQTVPALVLMCVNLFIAWCSQIREGTSVTDVRIPVRTHLRHTDRGTPSLRGPTRTGRPAPRPPSLAAAAHGRGGRRQIRRQAEMPQDPADDGGLTCATAMRLAGTTMQGTDDSIQARGGRGGAPVVLNAGDVAAFPEPGDDIAAVRDAIPHGRLKMIEYDSRTVGTTRKMQVCTPMIVVMPTDRVQPNDRAEGLAGLPRSTADPHRPATSRCPFATARDRLSAP